MARPVHFEIQASEPQVLIDFYSQLFGWTFTRWNDVDYWLIDTGPDQPGIDGGLLPRPGPQPSEVQVQVQPINAFVCTVGVEQIDQAMRQATTLGATAITPKTPVEGVGQLAYFKDPDGNQFGMMQFNEDMVTQKP